MVAWIGIRSPTDQPYFSARERPAMAPVRWASQDSISAGVRTYSGYIASHSCGSTAIWAKKFRLSW